MDRNYSRLTREEKIDLIVSGQVHLMDIRISNDIEQSEEHNYDGVIGLFCKLEFSLHKSEPSKCKDIPFVSFFMNYVSVPRCKSHDPRYNL